MSKKSIIAVLFILLLTAASILGLPLMAHRIEKYNPSGVTYVEGAPTETAKGLCLYSIDTGLFYGDREFRDGYYDFDNQSVFTINAMDGTVIDREYVY